MSSTTIESYFDTCPSEILYVIFKYLNIKTLLNCMVVNRRWYCIVSTILSRKGWLEVVKKGFEDNGENFKTKTELCWQGIIINQCLWQCVAEARAVHIHDFDSVDTILNIQLYRSYLIAVKTSELVYYDVNSYRIRRRFDVSFADYEENDSILAAVEVVGGVRRLNICFKNNQNSGWSEENVESFYVGLYKMCSDYCYIVKANNSLFHVKWTDGEWIQKPLARYYGDGYFTDIIVHEEEVFILLNWGGLLQVDQSLSKFNTLFNYDIQSSSNLKMSLQSGLVMTVPLDHQLTLKWQDAEHWILECPELTCCLQHGNMLLLGYKSGRVEIFTLDNLTKCSHPTPNLTLDVRQFAENLEDPSVRDLDVREVEGAHQLFIATRTKIQLVQLVYPESLRVFMLECCG